MATVAGFTFANSLAVHQMASVVALMTVLLAVIYLTFMADLKETRLQAFASANRGRFYLIEATTGDKASAEPLDAPGMSTVSGKTSVFDVIANELFNVTVPAQAERGKSASKPVAIIVPYRDRESHLLAFFRHITTFLSRQHTPYHIFIVEQVEEQTFNKGLLTNVGFVFADQMNTYSCFIFHDVDLLPLNEKNIYKCGNQPRHFAAAIDKFGFRQPYGDYVGGVIGLTAAQYRKVNGYGNAYWGWGGEDDDLLIRMKTLGMKVDRYPNDICRYKMIKHKHDTGNEPNPCRFRMLQTAQSRLQSDGLTNLVYKLIRVDRHPVYTRLVVDALPKITFKKFC